MNFGIAAAALLMLNSTPPISATVEAASPAVNESGPIPFKWDERSLIIIPVMINGRPGMALVDTGFANTVIDKAFADRNGMALTPIGSAQSVGGMESFYSTPHLSLGIGNMTLPDAAAQVTDLSVIKHGIGADFDAVIGASLLGFFQLRLNFDTRQLSFNRLGKPLPGGTSVPIDFDRNRRRITVQGASASRPLAPLLIDTGSDQALTLSHGAFASVAAMAGRTTDIQIIGAGGSETEEMTTMPSLMIGQIRIDRIITTVEPKGGKHEADGEAGGIGLDVLSRYNLAIDAGKGVMLLSPRRAVHPSKPVVTVGVQGEYLADKLVVTHVMARSPAADAGLKSGDAICSIDDTPITSDWFSGPMRAWQMVGPGHTFAVKLCTGRLVKLTSAVFY